MSEDLRKVRAWLASAERNAERSRQLMAAAGEARRHAFDLIPVGTVLSHRFPPPGMSYQVSRSAPAGSAIGRPDEFRTFPEDEYVAYGWVADEWDRGNWALPDDEG